MTAADMASIGEQPDVYQELVEASLIFSTITQVLSMQYTIVYCTVIVYCIVVVQEILLLLFEMSVGVCVHSFNLEYYNVSFLLLEGLLHRAV